MERLKRTQKIELYTCKHATCVAFGKPRFLLLVFEIRSVRQFRASTYPQLHLFICNTAGDRIEAIKKVNLVDKISHFVTTSGAHIGELDFVIDAFEKYSEHSQE